MAESWTAFCVAVLASARHLQTWDQLAEPHLVSTRTRRNCDPFLALLWRTPCSSHQYWTRSQRQLGWEMIKKACFCYEGRGVLTVAPHGSLSGQLAKMVNSVSELCSHLIEGLFLLFWRAHFPPSSAMPVHHGR
ncbi:hypothetical protein V8C42DRAFT_188610 [Trichoderma barbatum]